MANPKKLSDVILTGFMCLMIGYGTGAVLTERKKMVTLEQADLSSRPRNRPRTG